MNDRAFVPGDLVQPPKGTPLMRVREIHESAGRRWVLCRWIDSSDEPRDGYFRPDELELVDQPATKGGAIEPHIFAT